MSGSLRLTAIAAAAALCASTFALTPSASAAPVTKPAAQPGLSSAFDGKIITVQGRRRGAGARRGGGGRVVAPRRSFRPAPVARGRAFRGGPRYTRRRGPGWGRGVAIGAGAIVGAILLSEAARASYRRSGAWQRCADEYNSFDYDTGTIVTYDGDVILCPYLR